MLLLALVGAGSKAGLVPLHVWLPLAHPAAPSHVSALMSGVMTKVAIYGFIRIVFDLVGEPVWWTSLIVLALAAVTAVMGMLSALMQNDLKRLLAYSTVENVGIIFIGLGLALAFRANGMGLPAALALTAALFHVLNHSIFKSLLFFGAGAVLTATGERNMEQLGGLIHRMPRTAVAFLVGCAAISALPPLNGFVSEWLTFQAILVGPGLPQWGLRFMIPTVGALLALSAALAAACFVKAYGVVFLGRPRTPQAERAQEVDRFSLAAMFMLAALCFIAGVLPGAVHRHARARWCRTLVGARMPVQTFLPWASIVPIADSRSSYNGLLILLFLAVSGTLRRDVHPSLCHPRHRGGATSGIAAIPIQPARRNTPVRASPCRSAACSARPCSWCARRSICRGRAKCAPRIFRSRCSIRRGAMSTARSARAVMRAAVTLNQLQFLTIRRYLTLVFATLVLLLLVVAAWR